jgi:hypothetical protein
MPPMNNIGLKRLIKLQETGRFTIEMRSLEFIFFICYYNVFWEKYKIREISITEARTNNRNENRHRKEQTFQQSCMNLELVKAGGYKIYNE